LKEDQWRAEFYHLSCPFLKYKPNVEVSNVKVDFDIKDNLFLTIDEAEMKNEDSNERDSTSKEEIKEDEINLNIVIDTQMMISNEEESEEEENIGEEKNNNNEEKKKKGKKGELDFYVDSDLKWAVEFLREGDDLREHVQRFTKGGRYSHIPRKDIAILDFRGKDAYKKTMYDKVYYIIYDKEYSHFVVKRKGKEDVKIALSDPLKKEEKLLKKNFKYEGKNPVELEFSASDNINKLNIDLADKFGVKHVEIFYKGQLHLDPNELLDFIDPNSNDAIQVEPRKVFVRYGNKNDAIKVDVSNCLYVADFKEKITERYPDLKNMEFKLQFNGKDYDANLPLINLLKEVKDYSKDIVQILKEWIIRN